MPHHIPWRVQVHQHPGSSEQEINDEPDWTSGHEHRVGYRNRQDRFPGLTHEQDEGELPPGLTRSTGSTSSDETEEQFDADAKEALDTLREQAKAGELLNFRDIISKEKDFHLRYPENRSLGWRYVLETTEDWVKNEENWPANVERRKKEAEAKKQNDESKGEVQSKQKSKKDDSNDNSTESPPSDTKDQNEENDWKRAQGENVKHHDAYAANNEHSSGNSQEEQAEYEVLLERYSPQEISLLRALQHEKDYRKTLKQNDGKRRSPQTNNRTTTSIDEQDQFSPDNWLPRSEHLIRLTGKHPLNAEAELSTLFDAGLITPNELHYVRNHGAVPRILWEFHKLDVENGKLVLSMDDIKNNFEAINIAVALACDGNRRKELNMIKKSKGFNWGSGATGCAYWKGPLLRDVLLAAGVEAPSAKGESEERWVNFQGADEPSEGKYETCIPLSYAMDPTNDVLLAYEMNDVPLPPDHGYPVRLMIPGYVGGRCVKWLSKIWVSKEENSSHYHIWDNRVLPSFVTEKDGEFASALFAHPDTACNEQNLNSVIVKPAQGEEMPLTDARRGKSYRIEGYAYDGGGHEVQRVEVSLDGGESWLYCIRRFPEYPIRHGNKFWAWVHWYVDVSIVHLLQAKEISVRAWNVFKNTQPEKPAWNTMGMMNNCWYKVKAEISQGKDDDSTPHILFRHPAEPGTADGGWMKLSEEEKINAAKQAAGAPQKQFTRQEIEKHSTEDDCWLVVDGKVYDATSVLSWHPGGKAAIVGHAGKVHQETSDEFASIHDGFAYQKLKDCILGVVTAKTAEFIKSKAEAAAKEKSASQNQNGDVVLQKHRWVPVKLAKRDHISEDTRRYTFDLPNGMENVGLGTCQHIQLGFHLKDKMLIRSYTPTKPLLPRASEKKGTADDPNSEIQSLRDGQGTFELVVKTYFPSSAQPGGAMSNILDCMPLGEEIEIRGPTGEITYNGQGHFTITDEEHTFKRINLVLGGSGLTPGYALIARALLGKDENVELRVVDANKSEKDILLHEELDRFEQDSQGRLKVAHVLSHPSEEWKGLKGHVNEEILKSHLFPPDDDGQTACFLCGPPAMIQKAALPALRDWGFEDDKNIFGF
nr:nitrate reductase [nadh] 1 [Quercus suber]